jgi:homoserine/homoserine lactone efflux protein
VAYLIYLAVRQWRTAPVDLREQIGKATDGGRVALLVRGFLVNATNPKGLVFFPCGAIAVRRPDRTAAASVPGDRRDDGRGGPLVMGLYTALAVRLQQWMHTPRKQTVVNRVFSGPFAAAAVVLSLVRRGPATA